MKPLVSICCLTYNHHLYIEKCLSSFLAQEVNFKLEIIVLDDASIDGTSDIIREYESRHKDIFKYFRNAVNQYSQGVNMLVELFSKAQGKYIAFCEGDDYWVDPLKLQKQVDFLEANIDYGLVYTDIDKLHDSTGLIFRSCLTTGPSSSYHAKSYQEHLAIGGYLAPCTWVFRKSLLAFIEAPKGVRDFSFAFLLDVWANSKLYFLRDVTAIYRILDESASHTRNIERRFEYLYGLCKIKCHYINKYPKMISQSTVIQIKRDIYYDLVKFAILLGKRDVVLESQKYLSYNLKSWILSRLYCCPIVKRYLRHSLRKDGYKC